MLIDLITRRAVECMKFGHAITPIPRSENLSYKNGPKFKFDYDEMLRLYQEHKMTCQEIAKRCGCSKGTVQRALAQRIQRHPWTKEQIIERGLRGMKQKEIAFELGCSVHTVRRTLHSSNRYMDIKFEDKIMTLKRKGYKPLEIRDELNISINVVERVLGMRWK